MVLAWIILAVVAVIVVGYVVAVYNRFVNLRNGIESTFNQISVALKKRLDMIGQLVDSVKGEMSFEKETLTKVTELREQAKGSLDPEQAQELMDASNRLAGQIAVQVEEYPDLKASENVSELMGAVQNAEDEIARLRYTYNNTVQEFNTKRETVPSNIVAGMFGFGKRDYLEMQEGREALEERPDVDLST